MNQVIDTRHHDLKTGQVVSFHHDHNGYVKASTVPGPKCSYPSNYPSVRAMQRELLRRNRSQIRAGSRCAILIPDGILFYENDASYSYRTVQTVRLIP